ncbi:MAG TPA: anaerobic sulfatase-maturation protein [Bacteroidales bacterium]|nr:anaerobic sulfatase-maturation protein [Bacteroidales bacterium]HPT10385.1 anaerobic sulfatase-maturation protein [Bacteroidales bacterium]
MDQAHFPTSISLNMLAKPVGSTCNLKCTYCYYLEKENLYPGQASLRQMDDRVLEDFIAQTIYSTRERVVLFAWHGGEPLLRGFGFFNKVLQLQKKHGAGKLIENSLQTNGTLLTNEWCRFFSDHQFLIGISVDGPVHCHDHYRKYSNGEGSFAGCMKGLNLLIQHKVEFNTLSVVNDYTVQFPLEIYNFLKNAGSRFMQFLPVVERTDRCALTGADKHFDSRTLIPVSVTSHTVDPDTYGNFLITLFNDWVKKDVGECFVLTFDCVLANWMGVPPPVCVSAETCGNAGVVEFNGDVYSCDHFVFPEYRLGNIREKSLLTLMNSEIQRRFGRYKKDGLPAYCRRCEFLKLCNGECPKNRISITPSGEPGLNYLCSGLKKFYRHTRPFFDFMANELRHKRPPSNVKQWALTRRPAI